jgi:hypothetical protein
MRKLMILGAGLFLVGAVVLVGVAREGNAARSAFTLSDVNGFFVGPIANGVDPDGPSVGIVTFDGTRTDAVSVYVESTFLVQTYTFPWSSVRVDATTGRVSFPGFTGYLRDRGRSLDFFLTFYGPIAACGTLNLQ